MKITEIQIKHYLLPLDPPFKAAWDPEPREKFPATLVFVHTDEGFTGIGSGDLMTGFEGHEHLFIGRDPFDVERHAQVLNNIDFHYGRSWPLDIALWDLIGKITAQPVYKLLGGKQDKVLAYASTGELVSKEERARRAEHLAQRGFKAMKIRFHHQDVREDLAVVEEVRKAIGNKMEIMVDANQGWKMPGDTEPTWDLKMAAQVAKELEQLNVYWLEEPLPHDDLENMVRLRNMTSVRVAGGEMNRRFHEFRELSNAGALDVYQPDVALCGGITFGRKIADYVQANGGVYSPHTWTNGIGVAANLHTALGVGNTAYLEFPYDPPAWSVERRDFLQTSDTRLKLDQHGYLHGGNKPGLGFEIDEEVLKQYEIR
ncbi:mandelate racemase/muconate lactonizing enzyme family protein [Oceanobacillus neutriphilus]|uniref:Isomerase n=1 Tax=Oceanobacillus neutriphilus TaxID=531815 RepID=A0ABQ2NXU8_9BACI|nr:mandelate racemase/muconate lactonizing enzyme family protein [Oceanobacillus neutriphilus]GGP13249.1 isomerase [Oceanobacillus neutriphilus]